MIEQFKAWWLYGKHYCSVECSSDVKGATSFFAISAQKKKDEFIAIEQVTANTIQGLSEKLPKKQHCYVTINTDKVLVKETTTNGNEQEIITSAFPSLSREEFYTRVYNSDGKNFVAVCRKTNVQSILEEFESQNITVLGFEIGLFSLDRLAEYLPNESILTSRNLVSMSEGQINHISELEVTTTQDYEIEESSISSKQIIALAGLFNYVGAIDKSSSNNDKKNSVLEKTHSQKVFFQKGLYVGIAAILIILLVNALLFNSYYSKLSNLQDESQLISTQKEGFVQLKKDVERKEKLATDLLGSGNSRASFYLNRIVHSQPESILLSKLAYQPLERSIRPDKPITYKEKQIVVEGVSGESGEFSGWVKELEQSDWIEEVQVSGFSQSNGSSSDFSLVINVKQ